MNKHLLTTLIALLMLAANSNADTFQHRTKDIVYHGYATETTRPNGNIVFTQEKGQIELNLGDYSIEYNATGRNQHIALIPITGSISLEHETQAFTEAIVQEANKGPLLILIEIDTPGGRVDLAKQIVASIMDVQYTQTVAFVKGGVNGGAISAGAAVSLACDKIYMVPESSIGAATMIARTAKGTVDMKGAYGEAVGEKYNSAWRSYLASLAQENNRSGALAMAMADKDIVVVEVKRNGISHFIETKAKLPGDIEIRTVCRKGELLTLPAREAEKCRIADGVVTSRETLLSKLGYQHVEIKESQHLIDAKEEFEKVERKFEKLLERLDLKFSEFNAKNQHGGMTKSQAKRDLAYLIKNMEYLLNLKRTYPDIRMDEESLQDFLTLIKAEYAAVKSIRPR